jgi:hypothetical protein
MTESKLGNNLTLITEGVIKVNCIFFKYLPAIAWKDHRIHGFRKSSSLISHRHFHALRKSGNPKSTIRVTFKFFPVPDLLKFLDESGGNVKEPASS